MTSQEIIKKLKSLANPKNVAGMARFGINSKNTLGVNVPILRKIAKEIGRDFSLAKTSDGKHQLALELWNSKIHEARILATMIASVSQLTSAQMDKWAGDFDSWDTCDQACMNLFCETKIAFKKAVLWTKSQEEFVRRAGFALMACLAVRHKKAPDSDFVKFFPLIKKYATDERNYVRKAVNWALRQIGKRNWALNKLALKQAQEILKINSKSARWIASDALRELQSEAIKNILKRRDKKIINKDGKS
jgi:3-methyladenine DNA glycosylase AlkD